MNRPEDRSLLVGAALLAAAMLLFELLCFRMVAATQGRGFAQLVGVLMPAVAALGAMTLGWRASRTGGVVLLRTAAHHSALAGAFAAITAVVLTWVSQKVALARGEGELMHVILVISACLLPSLLAGSAIGMLMRHGVRRIGRFTFVTSAGAAVACLAIPLFMAGGAPRGAIGNGMLFGAAALCFAWAARSAKPHWAALMTLPLAVTALVAGDVGAPWLKMRVDQRGRRSRVVHKSWSAQGVISVDKVSRGKTQLRIDQHPPVTLAQAPRGNAKPKFVPLDLVYLLSSGEKRPVLVVGSSGGREIRVALANGHPRVDALETHGTFVNELLMDRYADVTGRLVHDGTRVHVRIGDGRSSLRGLPRDYQHVVVLDWASFDQAGPRLLVHHDRLFTPSALGAYLSHLSENGSMLVRVPSDGLPRLMASAVMALGGEVEAARERLVACSGSDQAVVVIMKNKPTANQLHKLKKRCRKSRYVVEFPIEDPRKSDIRRAELLQRNAASRERLDEAVAPSDELPFLLPPHPLSELKLAAVHSLQALRATANGQGKAKAKPKGKAKAKPKGKAKAKPKGQAKAKPEGQAKAKPKGQAKAKPKGQAKAKPKGQAKAKPKGQAKAKPKGQAKAKPKGQAKAKPKGQAKAKPGTDDVPAVAETAKPQMTPSGIAAAGAAVVLLLLLLSALVPPPRSRGAEGAVAAPMPGALRWAFMPLGAGLALCMFSLGDQLLRVSGDAAYGWGLVIPLGLVGLAGGRLMIDVVRIDGLRRLITVALIGAVLWMAMLHLASGTIAGLAGTHPTLRLGIVMLLLLLTGGWLGVPLAAGLRLVGAWDPAPVSWCWGTHLLGWAAGGAIAALLVYYVGVSKLFVLGFVAFAAGATLLSWAARKPPPVHAAKPFADSAHAPVAGTGALTSGAGG